MTPKKQDYLKIIFELGGTKKEITNKQIAMGLNVVAGSVTEMVNKLAAEGLVHHIPYAGVRLTETGERLAAALIRRHRLWETFLVDKLHYKLEDIHADAEILEHDMSENLMNHLDEYLGHPTHCPHGGVIPDKDGHYAEESHRTLASVADGVSVTVERFTDNHELLTYLDGSGLDIGDQLTVEQHTPFEGPIVVRLDNGKQFDVGYKAANYIFVRE